MLELTKKQTTNEYAEICIKVPTENAGKVFEALSSILALTDMPIREVNEDGEELFSVDEVFPDRRPGKTLKGLRLREELKQAELAELVGTSQHRISEFENGKRDISKAMAMKLAEALGTEYKVFL